MGWVIWKLDLDIRSHVKSKGLPWEFIWAGQGMAG